MGILHLLGSPAQVRILSLSNYDVFGLLIPLGLRVFLLWLFSSLIFLSPTVSGSQSKEDLPHWNPRLRSHHGVLVGGFECGQEMIHQQRKAAALWMLTQQSAIISRVQIASTSATEAEIPTTCEAQLDYLYVKLLLHHHLAPPSV